MPAKKEYLTSPGQRALKISAGIFGGYILSSALHLALATFIPFRNEVLLTGAFSVFICWVIFMVLAFLSSNGWKIWGIYLSATLFFALIIYFLR